MTRRNGRRIRRNCGFTLIEVLVGLVVLSIGMLGIAALLLSSVQGSRVALERTQAVNLASDIAERIRANRAAGDLYDTTVGTPVPSLQPACEDAASTCDEAAMASNDLKRWQDAIAATLPVDATGTIAVNPVTAVLNRYTITLSWPQVGEANPATYTLTVDI